MILHFFLWDLYFWHLLCCLYTILKWHLMPVWIWGYFHGISVFIAHKMYAISFQINFFFCSEGEPTALVKGCNESISLTAVLYWSILSFQQTTKEYPLILSTKQIPNLHIASIYVAFIKLCCGTSKQKEKKKHRYH